jgi:hypothetical protein
MSFRENRTFNLLNVSTVLDGYNVRNDYYFATLGFEIVLFVVMAVITFLGLLKAVKNISD